jgi:hypothetical protein
MPDMPKDMDPYEINGKQVNPDRSHNAKFRVYGIELIEKVVKSSGNSGRIYVPPSWVGKHVKIIRTD